MNLLSDVQGHWWVPEILSTPQGLVAVHKACPGMVINCGPVVGLACTMSQPCLCLAFSQPYPILPQYHLGSTQFCVFSQGLLGNPWHHNCNVTMFKKLLIFFPKIRDFKKRWKILHAQSSTTEICLISNGWVLFFGNLALENALEVGHQKSNQAISVSFLKKKKRKKKRPKDTEKKLLTVVSG